MTTACLRIFPKKKQKTFFFPVVNPAALISRKASVAVASADWLLVSLQLQNLPMSSAGAGDASGDAMWPHHSPALTPQLQVTSPWDFLSNLAKVSIQYDFRLGASCFIFFRPQKSAKKKRRKNPATRITIVNKMHEILNVTAAVFQAGDSCAATVDAAGPPSVKSGPLLAG